MQKFYAKNHKKLRSYKIIIYITIILFTLTFTSLNILNKNINGKIILDGNLYNKRLFNINLLNPKNIISSGINYNSDKIIIEEVNRKHNEKEPIIYLYNTHDKENYNTRLNEAYNMSYTVKTASYILGDYLDDYGITSYVEKTSTSKYLSENSLLNLSSYDASKKIMLDRIKEYPSLKYFIDIHRDSIDNKVASVTIDNKDYARILFVLGIDNKNYKENERLMNKINDLLPKELSRGIMKKGGKNVDGVYNQDINSNVILIEVGGVDSKIEEVDNTMKYLSKIIYEIVKE